MKLALRLGWAHILIHRLLGWARLMIYRMLGKRDVVPQDDPQVAVREAVNAVVADSSQQAECHSTLLGLIATGVALNVLRCGRPSCTPCRRLDAASTHTCWVKSLGQPCFVACLVSLIA